MEILENRFLYFLLMAFSLSYPLAQSFEKRIQFYKKWSRFFRATFFMMLLFIPWDIWFTIQEVWSFNNKYTIGLKVFGLPIEEWLFFIVIPFACVFIYEVLNYFFKTKSNRKPYVILSYVLALLFIVLAAYFQDKIYTFICFTLNACMLCLVAIQKKSWLPKFYRAYAVSLLPFLLINGFLTGSFTDEPVVAYNVFEIIGIRVLQIPIEDSVYSMLMLLIVIYFYEID